MKGFHFWINILEVTFPVKFMFNLRNNITSLTHKEIDGGLRDFHNSKMQRFSKTDEKAHIFDRKESILSCSNHIPNIAMKGSICIWVSRTFVRIVTNSVQNYCSLGQEKNIWVKLHEEIWLQSQCLEIFKIIEIW